MPNNVYTYLKFVRYKDLENWSVQYAVNRQLRFGKKYELIRIGTFLSRNKTPIIVEDDKYYRRVTVKSNNGGCCLRDKIIGKQIGTKLQFLISEGQFILSKIDARNGAMGVVPKECNNAIITGNFWTFDVNSELVDSNYLSLVTTTKEFIGFAEAASNGTTNRHYLQESLFLDVKIPLPTLEKQQALVKAYYDKIHQAAEQERRSEEVVRNIEDYLLAELGIKPTGYTIHEPSFSIASEPQVENTINYMQNADVSATYYWSDEVKKEHKYLKFVRYKDIDRWDCYNSEPRAISRLKQSCFPVVEIGKAYNFIKRNWDKKEKEFRYVEIGSVDALNGIMYAEKIATSKAPSRATQKIKTKDLIIGTTRPYLKKFAIVDEEYDDCICSSGFQVIAPNETYNLPFLYEYLKSSVAIAQFELFMTGALYPAITGKDLKKIQIPLPPIDVQNGIVNHINEMKNQIILFKQHAEDLRKKALEEFEKEIFE